VAPADRRPEGAGAGFDDLDGALRWLDGHIDFESVTPSRRSLPTLDRMRALVGVLGEPQTAAPVVHVTGTNGKGSTAAMVTWLLLAHGLTVGTYASPNLVRVNERIQRNGEPIDDDDLLALLATLARVEPMLDERPTRFELLTAAAFLWFADEAVDVVVLEVGLGGRWDCTNVADADVAVVTNISFDHTDVLGPTLVDIATDKAGIFTPGCRAVVGETDPALADLLRRAALDAGATDVWLRGTAFGCRANRPAVGGRLVDVYTPSGTVDDVLVPLHGAHQGDNAAVAVAAVEAFFGAALDPGVVAEGLGAVRIPGRLEVVGHRPLVVLDGAHNVAGMRALARALVEEFAVPGETVAVVGMLRGRDPVAMLEELLTAGVRSVVVCEPASPRALPASVVAEAATGLGMQAAVAPSVADALSDAMGAAGEDDAVVVCGSLYVVGGARVALGVGNRPSRGDLAGGAPSMR
jgi:dihydrofolate synthase/folylpolyglutamate synthase